MKRFSILALTVAVTATMTVTANAQIKNVLLEQHTGAWCGWCPDGTVVVDEILDLYGDRVIGVKIHTGDAMEIPETAVLEDTLGLSGVPTASIDRKDFGGSVFLDRGNWQSACESQMARRAKAEVDCFYTLNKTTRVVKITVVANITESMNFRLKFNAFIVEDDVTGTGSGYDQHNYLSFRPGYQDNPYYTQPSVLVGYHHMKVVRKMLGGAWGVAGTLPATVKAGQFYSHTFETTLSASWNIDKLHFVGLLQADAAANKEIVNCAQAVKDGSLQNRIIDSDTPAIEALPPGSESINTYTLENRTTKQQTYKVTLSKTERTPTDWSAQFASGSKQLSATDTQTATGQIVVPPSSTAQFSLTLKIGSTLGLGDAQVMLELQGTPKVKRSRIVSAITPEIEHLLLETGSEYSMRPYLSDTVCADAVTLEPDDYLAFADKLTDVKLIIWNKGPADGLSASEVEAIKNAGNTRLFLCGDGIIGSLSSTDLSYLGLEYIGWNLEAEGTTYTVWLCGREGDSITGDLGTYLEGHLICYYLNMVRIIDPFRVSAILRFQNDGLRRMGGSIYFVSAAEAIVGVKSTRNNTRTVLLGLSPYVLASEDTRQTLVRSIVDWLAQ